MFAKFRVEKINETACQALEKQEQKKSEKEMHLLMNDQSKKLNTYTSALEQMVIFHRR